MAIYKSGIYGRPNGKIGNMVFYMLKGQSVARSIGSPGKPSSLQLANHQAMSVTMKCIKHMVEFINEGFGLQAEGTTKNPYNLATSYNKKHALKGQYPSISVDYSKLLLSQGVLTAPQETNIKKTGNGITVTWDSYHDKSCKGNDMVMIMLYSSSESGREATSHLYAAKRSEGKCFIPVSVHHIDKPIEAYMFFKANNSKAVSDSVYLGNLNGTEETLQEKEDKTQYTKVKEQFKKIESKYLGLMNHKDGPPVESRNLRMMRTEYGVLQKKLAALQEQLALNQNLLPITQEKTKLPGKKN